MTDKTGDHTCPMVQLVPCSDVNAADKLGGQLSPQIRLAPGTREETATHVKSPGKSCAVANFILELYTTHTPLILGCFHTQANWEASSPYLQILTHLPRCESTSHPV